MQLTEDHDEKRNEDRESAKPKLALRALVGGLRHTLRILGACTFRTVTGTLQELLTKLWRACFSFDPREANMSCAMQAWMVAGVAYLCLQSESKLVVIYSLKITMIRI